VPLTGLLFLAGYLSGLGLALFRHPRYGVYTYLAVYYLDPPSRWWGAFLPQMRWSLVAGVVALLAGLRLKPPPGTPSWASMPPARLLIVFTIWLWLQNLWALAPAEHLELSILFTKYLIVFALIYRLCLSPQEIGGLLLVHIAGCFYLGWLVHVAPSAGRLEGVGGPGIDEANALAMFTATGVVCASMILLTDTGWRRWLAILAMPFLLNTIVQSQSRGAMIALVAAGLVLFYLRPMAYRKHFYVFGILGLVLFGMVAQSTFWDRMRTIEAAVSQDPEIDSSAESRQVLIQAQLRMAAQHPLGVGHRGTAVLSAQYLEEKWLTKNPNDPTSVAARSSHNSFMSALVEQGIPGGLIFLALVMWLARSIIALKRYRGMALDSQSAVTRYGPAAAAGAVVVIVAGLFTDYLKTEVQIWMFALLAVIVRVHLVREREALNHATQLTPEPVKVAEGKVRAGVS
jgi:O-antigen ligase